MKKIFMALIAVMTFGFAGGNIASVVPVVYNNNLGVYAGFGAGSIWTYQKGDFSFSKDTEDSLVDSVIGLKLGWDFYEADSFVLGTETRVLATFNSDDIDTSVYSVFLKPQYFVIENIGVYGLVGGSYTRWHVLDSSFHKTAVAFGLGVEYKVTDKVSVSADWVSNLWNRDTMNYKNLNNDAATAWLNYKF